VLKRLRRFLRGRPAVLVWDNLPAHHSQVMCDWLTSQRHWLQVEYLPAYAHDLDPVEGLWANLKGAELANLARDTVAEVLAAAQQGVARVRPGTRAAVLISPVLRPRFMKCPSTCSAKLFRTGPSHRAFRLWSK
jgi:hypothetical protein